MQIMAAQIDPTARVERRLNPAKRLVIATLFTRSDSSTKLACGSLR
jgi:hypothetical protein